MSEHQRKKPAGTFVKLPDEVFTTLFTESRKRGVTVQDLLLEAATNKAQSIQMGESAHKQ